MDTRSKVDRALTALLIAVLATATLASAALADRGFVRYRGGGPRFHGHDVVRMVHRGPVFIERHSDFGPIAGFLGGLVLGSVLSNAVPPPPPPPAYEYYDPYCHERFGSVQAYEEHLHYRGHPRTLEVIELRSGRCVDTWDWRDGRWCSRDDRDRAGRNWNE